VKVMESHGKAICFLRIKMQTDKILKKVQTTSNFSREKHKVIENSEMSWNFRSLLKLL